VGLQYSGDGALVDMDGVVNTLVREEEEEDLYFAPNPGSGSCVGIREGLFFRSSCTLLMRFICEYEYSGEDIDMMYHKLAFHNFVVVTMVLSTKSGF
jgi:hypothetical protein